MSTPHSDRCSTLELLAILAAACAQVAVTVMWLQELV